MDGDILFSAVSTLARIKNSHHCQQSFLFNPSHPDPDPEYNDNQRQVDLMCQEEREEERSGVY